MLIHSVLVFVRLHIFTLSSINVLLLSSLHMKMILFCFKICQFTLVRSVIPFLAMSAIWATFHHLLPAALCVRKWQLCPSEVHLESMSALWRYNHFSACHYFSRCIVLALLVLQGTTHTSNDMTLNSKWQRLNSDDTVQLKPDPDSDSDISVTNLIMTCLIVTYVMRKNCQL